MPSPIRLLVSLVFLTGIGACAAESGDAHGRVDALTHDCIVRGDGDAFELDLALKFFKWNGVTHDAVGLGRLENAIDDLRAKLAAESDPARIDKLERRIVNGEYLLRYSGFFLNSSGKIAKRKVKLHDPFAIALCDDGGCEEGADEDARFVHHAYRTFLLRDATSAELGAALAQLPDRDAPDYEPTADYRDELADWVRSTFTDGVCDAGIIDPYFYYRKLARVALGRDPDDSLITTIELDGEIVVLNGSCESQIGTAYSRTFYSTEYLTPAPDSYRYNLNHDAAPVSCPSLLRAD